MTKTAFLLCAACLSVFVNFKAFAADQLDEFKTIKGSEVRFSLPSDYFNLLLTISGPNGFHARSYSKAGSAAIDLIRAGATVDGFYTYELTAASRQTTDAKKQRISLDGSSKSARNVGTRTSGSFYAAGGLIVSAAK